jgi:hypothetical protein
LSVRVLVQNTLDDLPLVDRYRADLEVLLSNEHCETRSANAEVNQVGGNHTFNWPFVREIVLEQILALSALELPEGVTT